MAPKSPNRIVLIEDNPADVTLLRQALGELAEPFELEVLPDGEAALEFVRARGSTNPEPCLIVLDLHLPRHDGTTVLRAIKSDPELAKVDVFVLTTMASPEEREEAMRLGVRGYCRKPMDWDEMLALARELMSACTRGREEATAT